MITIGEACDLARKHYREKAKSTGQHTYEWHKNEVEKRFGRQLPLRALDYMMVQEYCDEMLRRYAPATVHHRISFINKLFKLAKRQGFKLSRPTDIELPKLNNKKRNYIQLAALNSLKRVMRPWQGSIIELAFFTGLRRLEIYMLRPEDVTFWEEDAILNGETVQVMVGEANVTDSKTGEARICCLSPEAAAICYQWKIIATRREADYLVGPYDNRPRIKIAACLSEALKRACGKVGVKATLHTMRHSFATHALRHGAKKDNIQHQLGHRHITETDRYAHADQSVMWPAVFAVSKYSRQGQS